jgi:TolB-like protein
MGERNADVPAEKRIEFRFGIHQGDIIVEDGDIFGDGVNLAARLEGLAEPGSICVSGRVHADALGKVDVAFDDLGERSLKNIARPLRVFAVRIGGAGAKISSVEKLPLPLPDKPSIAVLPFQNMSGDPEQEYFADGMVEEIITALSRIRWLFVIARNSSFTYKGQAVDVKQVGRELGVRYVLEGSVRKAGGRVRITAQLIDALSGAHLWADRFDGSLEDIFEFQDEVASSVAGVIEPTLQVAEIRRSAERPTSDHTAYDLYLRALSQVYVWDKEALLTALDLLDQAIERDPQYGLPLALAARCHQDLHVNGWSGNPKISQQKGIDLARQALRFAGDDPGVLGNAAYVLGYFGEDIDTSIELIDRALALNPSFARGWVISGWIKLWAGQPEAAIGNFETSLRLSPHARRAGTFMCIGVGHFFARRFDDARAMLLRSLQDHPSWAPTYRFLAASCAHMGRLDEAHEIIRRLRAITPVIVPDAGHWRNPEQRDLYLEGLRLAAGEAT